jgi:hypothetical protein
MLIRLAIIFLECCTARTTITSRLLLLLTLLLGEIATVEILAFQL